MICIYHADRDDLRAMANKRRTSVNILLLLLAVPKAPARIVLLARYIKLI